VAWQNVTSFPDVMKLLNQELDNINVLDLLGDLAHLPEGDFSFQERLEDK